MLKSRQLPLVLLAVLLLSGCDWLPRELRVYSLSYQDFDPRAMQAIFEQRSGVSLARVERRANLSALEALATDQADLAIVENSAAFVPGVRVLLPIHESVMHLLVRNDLSTQTRDLNRPLLGRTIYIANNSNAGHAVIDVAAQRQHLRQEDYTIVDELVQGETDFVLYFGPINASNTQWYREGYSFISLDQQSSHRRRFSQEGISYLIPQMKPMVIPAQTYDLPGNEQPILTMSVDSLLLTRKDLPEKLVYQIAKTFIEQKPRFAALAPQMFSGISESFDPLALNFPLHNGVRRYLQRDEPSFLERYAEIINMLVYLAFLLLTGLLALARWRAQRKKDRIDTFYVQVLSIRDGATGEDPAVLLQHLSEIEREAFESLISEKLAADESFRIFTDLMARTRVELQQQLAR
jgi:TRAP-type uncharacterized transport system substrate-binding protein